MLERAKYDYSTLTTGIYRPGVVLDSTEGIVSLLLIENNDVPIWKGPDEGLSISLRRSYLTVFPIGAPSITTGDGFATRWLAPLGKQENK